MFVRLPLLPGVGNTIHNVAVNHSCLVTIINEIMNIHWLNDQNINANEYQQPYNCVIVHSHKVGHCESSGS